MISHKHTANSVGGKTARACDNCIRKRARWYCAADDAFLCQSCDVSVHSANPLARRHERVRLKTASCPRHHLHEFPKEKKNNKNKNKEGSWPSWHRGFTKKARTPRHGKPAGLPARTLISLVPEFGVGDETSNEENDEQLLYRVPGYDETFPAEPANTVAAPTFSKGETKGISQEFHPSDMELAEFAADVESLLGTGLEDESFGIEGLGLMMDCDKESRENSSNLSLRSDRLLVNIKEEEEEGLRAVDAETDGRDYAEIDISKETFQLNFDGYGSPATWGEEDEDEKRMLPTHLEANTDVVNGHERDDFSKKKREIFLKLDYESVITAWARQGSPWTSRDRPDLHSSDDLWLDCLGNSGGFQSQYVPGGGGVGYGGLLMAGTADAAERAAKVSRYREKRRRRLFSKKIRYAVRKLNAEKRPRMKGRFVKRPAAHLGPASFPTREKVGS
ncbi:hypothetical protein SAY86_017186 [Trapa natans]|uniref:Uncharacterized protein n=1 Tax=Trapa natans TaxID=22666 RepID=A0AAN7LPZ5_TRANT|nr:hypothetical protein SAY86_017186 [Trapa natans]